MAVRFRKSKKIAPGVKLNISNSGLSVSLGPKGFKRTYSTSGRKTTTVSVPGTGLYYSKSSTSKSARSNTKNKNTHNKVMNVQAGEVANTEVIVSEKSKFVALLLCIFLGAFGGHRFYVGKHGTGLLWLFTVGGLGFGWPIDLITIAIGKFRDKSGAVLR